MLNQTVEEQLVNARKLLVVAGKRIDYLENEVLNLQKEMETASPRECTHCFGGGCCMCNGSGIAI